MSPAGIVHGRLGIRGSVRMVRVGPPPPRREPRGELLVDDAVLRRSVDDARSDIAAPWARYWRSRRCAAEALQVAIRRTRWYALRTWASRAAAFESSRWATTALMIASALGEALPADVEALTWPPLSRSAA